MATGRKSVDHYDENWLDLVSDNDLFAPGNKEQVGFGRAVGFGFQSSDEEVGLGRAVGDDNDVFGFQSLDEECYCVYRACHKDEDISKGIFCKDPSSGRTVAQHIASGNRNPSKYISTTANQEVALLWAFYEMDTETRKRRPEQRKIVCIYLYRVKGTKQERELINLTNRRVREHFVKAATHRSWAMAAKEVLFQNQIPREMYDVVEKLDDPPQPPPKKKKENNKDVLDDQ